MTANPNYRPTNHFRDQLEREVRRRFRRADRLRLAALDRRRRWARVSTIVVVSATIGATAGLASAQIRQSAGRDSLLAAARAEAALAGTRAGLARAQADDVALRLRVGAVDQQSLDAAIAELREMESRRDRAVLDTEEVAASGLPPRDDLGAPLIDSRDYVKLRLELRLAAIDARLREAEARHANAAQRADVGASVAGELFTADVDVATAKAELSVLVQKLKLRAEYLEHRTFAEELPQRVETAQRNADASVARAKLAAAQGRLGLVQKRRSSGLADDVELLRAQLEVKEQELTLQRLALRLRSSRP